MRNRKVGWTEANYPLLKAEPLKRQLMVERYRGKDCRAEVKWCG